MISKDKITQIFCSIDDFCLVFDPAMQKRQLSSGKKTRKRKSRMSTSEIVTPLARKCFPCLERTIV